MSSLYVKLLGGFEICDGSGAPVGPLRRQAQAVLAVLALNPGVALSRDKLAALFWSERGDSQARGGLRSVLSDLRKAFADFDPPPLIADRETVRIDSTAVEVDAVTFARLIDDGTLESLERAAALYQGEFLDGLGVQDAVFEEWVRDERARLHDCARAAVSRLLEHRMAAGETDDALATAKRLLGLDPTHEGAHRALMRIYTDTDDRALALKQYRTCCEVLRAELGIEPEVATQQLLKDIRHAAGAPADQPHEVGGREHLELPDKPSIAVLPFVNMSGDSEQEYFSDGVTEDIISELSRFRELFVIARNSSFSHKGKAAKVQDIATDLGVRYVLEGSVRAAGGQIRVTAQLIDAETGHHIWSERYNREIADLFAVQDEIAQTVAGTVAGRLKLTAEDRAKRKPIENLEAYDYALRGQSIIADTKENNLRARQAYEKAIDLDPTLTRAYVGMALSYSIEWFNYWWDPADPPLDHALEYAAKAVSLENTDSKARLILGNVYQQRREYEEAKVHLERALELNPNDADAYAFMGNYLGAIGKPDEAINCYLTAMRLNPYYPAWYLWELGDAYFSTRQYEKALVPLKEALNRNPKFMQVRKVLAATYVQLDRIEEARAVVEELLVDHPDASVRQELQWDYASDDEREMWLEALRKAGLPE